MMSQMHEAALKSRKVPHPPPSSPHLFSCLWVQVGVQEGDGELYLPGAPGFHGGTVCWRGGQGKEEEEERRIRTREEESKEPSEAWIKQENEWAPV